MRAGDKVVILKPEFLEGKVGIIERKHEICNSLLYVSWDNNKKRALFDKDDLKLFKEKVLFT